MRLLREYPSAVLLVLFGIGFLIAYLVARGRRLGARDLIFFAIMAAFFDWLVYAGIGMLRPGDYGNLLVLGVLFFAVPVGAFATLGVVVIALRLLHIAGTGGSSREDPPETGRGEKIKGLFMWMVAPVRWRGVCIVFVGLMTFTLLKGVRCNCGPVVVGAIDILAMLAAAAACFGVVGYVRWYQIRKSQPFWLPSEEERRGAVPNGRRKGR